MEAQSGVTGLFQISQRARVFFSTRAHARARCTFRDDEEKKKENRSRVTNIDCVRDPENHCELIAL